MKSTKQTDIKRAWHLINAKNQVVGRLSTQIAHLLLGKNKPYYSPYLDCGDYVVVINAKNVVFSGKKETQKIYWRHSGYPGGLKSKTAADLRTSKPEELVRHAVVGMLPKNKLARMIIKKLYIYPQSENPHGDKFKN
ncbi:50S ribosomal protein L13 [Candidatus Curtissbacteria bacterium]|nr:50S ribosomal protein L13 [Candidatus Curtissbacteria bacterium]